MSIQLCLLALASLSAPCFADSLREAVISQSIEQHNADVRSGSFQSAQAFAQQSKVVTPVVSASFTRGAAINVAAAPTTNSSVGATAAGPVPQDPPKKIIHPQKKH